MLKFCQHTILFFVFITFGVTAQESNLLWQKTIGGIGDDRVSSIASDGNGNIYILGELQSSNGQNINNDIFVARLDEGGNIIWKKIIGGSRDETGASILIDSHNEVVVLFSSNSTNGYFANNAGNADIYMLRLTSDGVELNISRFGGTLTDIPSHIMQAANGNYIVSGQSQSSDGDLTENFGQFDMWVLEVSYSGNIVWQKSYGASDEDYVNKVLQRSDGSYMIFGESASYDGAFDDNLGDFDIALLNIDETGSILWQKCYGGFYSENGGDLVEMPNGNILVATSTFSDSYDVSSNAGGSDIWLFEVDKTGDLVWDKSYGSYGNETVASLKRTTSGYVLLGTSNSSSIQNSVSHGAQDLWLYELDHQKNSVNHALFGASGFESARAMIVQENGSILMAGSTNSTDGLVQGNQGKNDGWLLKIGDFFTSKRSETRVHPNPSNGIFYLNQLPENPTINVYDYKGQVAYTISNAGEFAAILDITHLPAGMYILSIVSEEGSESHKLVVR